MKKKLMKEWVTWYKEKLCLYEEKLRVYDKLYALNKKERGEVEGLLEKVVKFHKVLPLASHRVAEYMSMRVEHGNSLNSYLRVYLISLTMEEARVRNEK